MNETASPCSKAEASRTCRAALWRWTAPLSCTEGQEALRQVKKVAVGADLLGGTVLQQEGGPRHDLHPLTHPPLPWVHCNHLRHSHISQHESTAPGFGECKEHLGSSLCGLLHMRIQQHYA